MVVTASLTGLIRTLLIVVGAIVLLRFLGQLMNAKRNMEEEREMNENQRKFAEEKRRKTENLGKTQVLSKKSSTNNIEDVDFEEVE